MPRLVIVPLIAVTLAGFSGVTRAGIYSPDEPTPFRVRADGIAEELPFGPQFEGPFAVQFGERLNQFDSRAEAVRGSKNEDRLKLLKRIEALKGKPGEVVALSAAYLRAGESAEALNLLAPLSRARAPDFRVLANLAHAHAVRGEWDEAVNRHSLATLEVGFPDDLPGSTPDQRKWLQKVERQYYSKWLQIHRHRALAKSPPEREEILPLFDVKFVNDAGKYEPGKLAAAEKAKLPPDAIAIVQQLLLWAPWDTSLYWLLAELYAAEGRVQPADVIFFQCANSRQYSNRQTLMDHRLVVREAAEKARKDAPTDVPLIAETPPEPPKPEGDHFLPSTGKVIAVGAVFGLVLLALLALQVRAIGRRRKGCGPTA